MFLPVWNNIKIDRHIRKFYGMVSNTLEEVLWFFNRYWKDYFVEEQYITGWR
jgi:hypothetical protein